MPPHGSLLLRLAHGSPVLCSSVAARWFKRSDKIKRAGPGLSPHVTTMPSRTPAPPLASKGLHQKLERSHERTLPKEQLQHQTLGYRAKSLETRDFSVKKKPAAHAIDYNSFLVWVFFSSIIPEIYYDPSHIKKNLQTRNGPYAWSVHVSI